MPKGSFESIVSGFLKAFDLVDTPHLSANFQHLLTSASRLGAASCENVSQLWCGPKGIGKTSLLRALCAAGELQKLAEAKHPRHRHCKYLTAVYIDLRSELSGLTFSEVLYHELLRYKGPLPVGFGSKLRTLSAEPEGSRNSRISKLNKLLSESSVAVLCVVDAAENLYKQGMFTDDLSKIWVRDLLMLTGLPKRHGTNVSIGVVMCCSLARARQLFLLEVGESREMFGAEYQWAYRCMNWNGTKLNQMVCGQPSWSNARLLSYLALCVSAANIMVGVGGFQCPMEWLLANATRGVVAAGGRAAASGGAAVEVNESVQQPDLPMKYCAPAEGASTLQQPEGRGGSDSVPGESKHKEVPAEKDLVSPVPVLSPAEALQLLLAYTGGNHRAIKTFVEHLVAFLPTFDADSHSFSRDAFVAQLDWLAMNHDWDVSRPLSDGDKRVVCELLALLPSPSTPLDLSMHFDQDKFTVPKHALTAKLLHGDLDRAADSGAVFVSGTTVAISSPATLFRYTDSGVDFEMLRWMLFPLGAFSERLKLPVAQAIARGAKQLIPEECALSSQTVVVQETRDSGGQALLPFTIGVCSVDTAPHTHFVNTARLVKLAHKLEATPAESKIGKVTRRLAWGAITSKVLELVEAWRGGESGAAADDKAAEAKAKANWVLNVLLAAPVEKRHRIMLQQHDCCFAVKEHPDVYGGDALFVHIAPAGRMSMMRVQVKVASPSSLKQEVVNPAAGMCFDSARAAVDTTISGFAGSESATSATAAMIEERNASIALFMAAVRAASELKQAGHTLKFSCAASAKLSIERIIAQEASCKDVDCHAALATTHLLRKTDRNLCNELGIAAIDCQDLYGHWGPCGLLARKLRAAPFWLPDGSTSKGARLSELEEDEDEFDY